jgi:ABC-type polar amino acid transport system ATPase subunit
MTTALTTASPQPLTRLGQLDPHRLPGQLSVGQCQRVAIARALITRPVARQVRRSSLAASDAVAG